jgi:hypothetical protein
MHRARANTGIRKNLVGCKRYTVFLSFFYSATEERERQIQTGGGSVQEIPGTGHPGPVLYRCCSSCCDRKTLSGRPVNTKKTIESVINS